MADDITKDDAKPAKAKKDDTTTDDAANTQAVDISDAPDAKVAADKAEGLRKQITDLQVQLVQAEADEKHAAAAANLDALRKAHDDAEGNSALQDTYASQIDMAEAQVKELKAIAEAGAQPGIGAVEPV